MQNMLGQGGENKYVDKIKKKLAEGKYPEHVRQAIECELQNILDLGDGNPEINKKKYLDLLTLDIMSTYWLTILSESRLKNSSILKMPRKFLKKTIMEWKRSNREF